MKFQITLINLSLVLHHTIAFQSFWFNTRKQSFFHEKILEHNQIVKKETRLTGWVQDDNGEWIWKDDALEGSVPVATATTTSTASKIIDASTIQDKATPQIPSGKFKPKQSLGQNFLRDGNTVGKIVRTFAKDASETLQEDTSKKNKKSWEEPGVRPVELGPGPGALTGTLVDLFGQENLQCIEIDDRAVELLGNEFPKLRVRHQDVLQVDYPQMAKEEGGPLSVIGNLPYYITSQILFALADASQFGAVRSATVTMQWEVAQRIVAPVKCKDYGILSVVFQLYADCKVHFKIPPTVFYPQPKVDSALVGIRFVGPETLRLRLAGVNPRDLRKLLNVIYQQRRKTVRNSLKKMVTDMYGKEKANEILDSPPLDLPQSVKQRQEEGDEFALSQNLPNDWVRLRPEELSPGQTVELTRLIFGENQLKDGELIPWDTKVWRKWKHGANN